jgi:hypothetical protein
MHGVVIVYVWGIFVLECSIGIVCSGFISGFFGRLMIAEGIKVACREQLQICYCIMGVAVFIAVYRLSSADNKTVVLLRGLIQPMCFASF